MVCIPFVANFWLNNSKWIGLKPEIFELFDATFTESIVGR